MHALQTNTFQVALVYNQDTSFVFFFYDEINLSGSRIANIGFNPTSFCCTPGVPFNVPGVFSGGATLSDVVDGSNTGVPGFYAYRVDMEVIIQPGGTYV